METEAQFGGEDDDTIELALRATVPITDLADELLRLPFEGDGRKYLASAYAIQVFEHWNAILLLISTRKAYGSAFALFRVLFETSIRGHWLDLCATEDQFQRFTELNTFRFPSVRTMTDSVMEKQEHTFFDPYQSVGAHVRVHA